MLAAGALGHAVIAKTGDDGDKPSISLQELRNFSEAFALIKRQYVDEIDDGTLMRNAMRGMASKLDPYTTYLDREELDDWEVTTSGEFGGLGIVVSKDEEDSAIKVVSPIDDTPAKRAGVHSGDLILKLDGESTYDLSLHEAVQVMRGKPGTSITLTLSRTSQPHPFEVSITRAVIKIDSVRSRILEPGYAYLRISNFQVRTSADALDHLERLQNEDNDDLRGIILDLRNNPGGLFSSAVEISDAFLDHNQPIVSTRGRNQQFNAMERTDSIDQSHGVPIIVLINNGSASASEIVAGALQDNGRAQLLGTRSYGKGSVQTLLPLNNQNAAIKLTTARYYTPSGRSIHEKGIEPDYLVEFESPDDEEMEAIKEDEADSDAPQNDNQIQAALELLKHGELDLDSREARSP